MLPSFVFCENCKDFLGSCRYLQKEAFLSFDVGQKVMKPTCGGYFYYNVSLQNSSCWLGF